MSILNKYKRWKPLLLLHTEHIWDFVISQDNTPTFNLDGALNTNCLSSYIDFTNKNCISGNTIQSISDYFWENSKNDSVKLNDIALTGIDNGLISYRKDRISNKDFVDLFLNTSIEYIDNDFRLKLNKIHGNTLHYDYTIDEKDNYIALKGGFYQGFFKLYGFNYQVLPCFIEDEWNLEFVLRPQDYTTKNNILNKLYPENSGIFFYIGTRAENKFAQFYGGIEKFEDRPNYVDSCDTLIEGTYESISLGTPSFFGDDYVKDENIKDTYIETSTEKPIDDKNYYEFETDNKFLIFDRTCNGFTVDTYDNEIVKFVGSNTKYGENLFLLMNRGCSGYTIDTLDTYTNTGDTYNVISDIKDNAFALKINEDGSIGYRFLVSDCNNEKGFSILEEYSYPNIIEKYNWNVINVKLAILNGDTDDCGVPFGKRKMKLYFYINGKLKFISKELPEIYLKPLDEEFEKQEGVPYNISLGGGTQGLMESIWLNYYDDFQKVLPLEKNFAGTFIGDIKSFKFYTCKNDYNNIVNNYIFEKRNIS